jgi:membrane protease YdiL (CAAX protease family)
MPHPAILSCLYLLLGLSVFIAWWGEFRRRQKTHQEEGFWPGTTSTTWSVHALVVSGVLFLTLLETAIEVHFGVSQSQSTLPSYAIAALLGASLIEEIVFRGFAAPGQFNGSKLLSVAVVGSLVFAVIHQFDLSTTEGKISTAFSFLISLWLYFARFNPLNKQRSLLPCFMGHIVRNLAVFGIKWIQGFVN